MLTVLGFLSCMLLFGQQEWILKGRVMAAGKPVNGATVSVLQPGWAQLPIRQVILI